MDSGFSWNEGPVVAGHAANMVDEYKAWSRARALILGVYILAEWRARIPAEKVVLLDIGCGCGPYLMPFMSMIPGLCYIGCDRAETMIQYAQAYWMAKANKAWQWSFFCKDMHEVSTDHADIVFAAGSIEYTADPLRTLYLLLQNMNPGQIFILQKLRLSPKVGGSWFEELTYAGRREKIYLWGRSLLTGIVERISDDFKVYEWPQDNTLTIAGSIK